MTRSSVLESQQRINDLVCEHLALENAELRARVIDLESERDVYRFWFTRTLGALAAVDARERRRFEDQENQRSVYDELRDLRAMVVSEYYDDAIAVMGSDTFARVRASLSTDSPSPAGETFQ